MCATWKRGKMERHRPNPSQWNNKRHERKSLLNFLSIDGFFSAPLLANVRFACTRTYIRIEEIVEECHMDVVRARVLQWSFAIVSNFRYNPRFHVPMPYLVIIQNIISDGFLDSVQAFSRSHSSNRKLWIVRIVACVFPPDLDFGNLTTTKRILPMPKLYCSLRMVCMLLAYVIRSIEYVLSFCSASFLITHYKHSKVYNDVAAPAPATITTTKSTHKNRHFRLYPFGMDVVLYAWILMNEREQHTMPHHHPH